MSTGPRRIGKYELQERLGRGGMAEVWKAFDPHLRRYVAIKLMHTELQNDPTFITRFEREARVVASLHHPNIVQVHDFQISRPSEFESAIAYMVMDYVEGPTLANYIQNTSRIGRFPSAIELINLFTSISSAIDYAHQKGMVHRDIKPANILLDRRNTTRNPMGEPILSDFGIVRLLGASSGTLSGVWLGTPLYISPEQARGRPGDERSDIYSLGVILYEICTGVRPFQGDNALAIIVQHINATPTPPNLINLNVPPALAEVIMCCLSKDPAARFPTASSMVAALSQALNPTPPVNLNIPVYPTYPATGLVYQNPALSPLPVVMTPRDPTLPAVPIDGSALPPSSDVRATPQFPVSLSGGQNTPIAISGGGSVPSALANSAQNRVSNAPLPSTPMPAPPTPRPGKRRRTLFIALIALVVLLIAGMGLGFLYLFSQGGPSANQTVGYAFFGSSGQIGDNTIQGLNDELQINLQNIAPPAAGKSYYAWLLPDLKPDPTQKTTAPILLGRLSVDNGKVQLPYRDPNHTNLLEITSRFLVTEESASITPRAPGSDYHTWRYYAQFSQTPIPGTDGSSTLDKLRTLLVWPVHMDLYGGLNIHLSNNTQKVLEWAVSAKAAGDNKDAGLIHKQVVRILDYIEGTTLVKVDLPNVPLAVDNPTLAEVPLIIPGRYQNSSIPTPGDYLTSIDHQLLPITQASDVPPEMLRLAKQIREALPNVQSWLEKVYEDAKHLVNLTNAELLQATSQQLLEDMESQANYAYNGQPGSSGQQGVVWIYNSVQRLATFDVMVCPADSTPNFCV